MNETPKQIGTITANVFDCCKRVYDPDAISPTLNAHSGGHTETKIAVASRVRKLTPRECWRLMGFDNTDFDKARVVNSDTQLYKQAGNSIVVNVLQAILSGLLAEERSDWLDEILEE